MNVKRLTILFNHLSSGKVITGSTFSNRPFAVAGGPPVCYWYLDFARGAVSRKTEPLSIRGPAVTRADPGGIVSNSLYHLTFNPRGLSLETLDLLDHNLIVPPGLWASY